jgi:hypothetical protein
VDGDDLSVAELSATNGTITNNGNGTYTFTPADNYNGSVNLTYNVVDGNGGTVAASQSFSITSVNDAPTGTATATLATGVEDTPYIISAADLLAGFSDVDGDSLSVAELTASNSSLADNGDGTYTFTPDANYNGSVSLTYNVIDGNGGTWQLLNPSPSHQSTMHPAERLLPLLWLGRKTPPTSSVRLTYYKDSAMSRVTRSRFLT